VNTNANVFRVVGNRPICDGDPDSGKLSRLPDRFHAFADATVGTHRKWLRHLCYDCIRRHHKYRQVRHGIYWK
jgi:hypothetical protein